MKLSKIKKVCTDALQLRVVDTCGHGNNMVHQWVGTQEALYPVEGMTLSEEMLKVLWELSDKQVAAIEEAPVYHDPEFLLDLPGLIDKDNAERITLGQVADYGALMYGEDGVVFVDPALMRPCGTWRQFVIVHDDKGPWVVVYDDGKLDAVVRPVNNELAGHLMAIAKAVAGRTVEERAAE